LCETEDISEIGGVMKTVMASKKKEALAAAAWRRKKRENSVAGACHGEIRPGGGNIIWRGSQRHQYRQKASRLALKMKQPVYRQ